MHKSTHHRPPRLIRSRPQQTSRLFAMAFDAHFQRVCRLHRELPGGDIDLAIISVAVALAASGDLTNDVPTRNEFASVDAVIGKRQPSIRARSIAYMAGLPRETVRRKMGQLVELGILTRRSKARYIVSPGFPQAGPYRVLLERWTAESLRFFNECLERGLIEVEHPPS